MEQTVKVSDLPKAQRVVFEENGVRYEGVVRQGRYMGSMVSRLQERNAITALFGLPKPGGSRGFWSFDEDDGSGFFLADVLVSCAKGYGRLFADGKPVEIPKDVRFEGSTYSLP